MLKRFIRLVGGDPNKKEIESFSEIVDQINALEAQFEQLGDDALKAKTGEFRARLREQTEGIHDAKEFLLAELTALDELLPEAFAAVREASKRTIGLRHYDVQLIGGITLHKGRISEMRTGEGKTLVATLPLYLNALTGRGVHLVTVNDYLARRDARWMGPIYNALGFNVGVLQIAARTENGKKAFLVDLEKESPHEDQHQLRMVDRREAYAADFVYGTNSEFGFDYLRDNMTMRLDERVQRGHFYAIVDEVDNILIDEARTPLIISGPAQDESESYIRMSQAVRQLRPEDYEVDEKNRNVNLTDVGEAHVEELLGVPLRDPERPEDATPEQARTLGYLEQCLRAHYLYKRNKDYLVQASKVVIVDEFTGRLMPGRRWSDGLHQAVEAKEGVKVQSESVTYATITIQNYFRMYEKLAGMTGTALTEAEEFDKIYKLGVLAIPTNLEFIAMYTDSSLIELENRDAQGYKYQFYTNSDDPEQKPVFWKRQDYPDVIYRTEEAKLRAIAGEILRYHSLGRPLLVGTTSVELSERVSSRLRAEPLRRLAQTLLLRDAWVRQYNVPEDGRQIPELQFLNTPFDKLDVGEVRKLARDLNLPFNPEDPNNLTRLGAILDIPSEKFSRLVSDLAGGIPHEVLNARKHTEESQIIAGAGAFGAVTIATNMAGRGVDIKLGGELAEEVLASVNRILSRAGHKDAYDMTMPERRQALNALSPDEYGIYGAEMQFFLKHMDEMEQVRQLGGLHVIGSERHEARRIDNQLRGRSARQGDPGSSRFYLSMEDELMRLFGGTQADAMMQRLKIDDALPLEVGLVSRLVEQAQTRVEGANFDVRKHLLEYDDVLNTQRKAVYNQRDRIFTKEDLTDDVTEMLRSELTRRVPEALKNEGGPWKLLAWLEQIQPPVAMGEAIYPSYAMRLLVDHLTNHLPDNPGAPEIRLAMLNLARQSIETEKQHHLSSIRELLETTEDRLKEQVDDHLEIVDTFFDGLADDYEGQPRRPTEIVTELNTTVGLPIKLSSTALNELREDPDQARQEVREQVELAVYNQAVTRMVGSVARRLEEPLDISFRIYQGWGEFSAQVLEIVEKIFEQRLERNLGGEGVIVKDLDYALSRMEHTIVDKASLEQALLQLLIQMPQGARALFDKRTHKKVLQRTTRLNYIYYTAHLLEYKEPEEVAEVVLEHLEGAQQAICLAWGQVEWNRLSNRSLTEFDEAFRQRVVQALEETGWIGTIEPTQPLSVLETEVHQVITTELGRRALSELYRQLLQSVITELWVDYLTQMEALRVSIGLEAYGQRDPLVQYKNRAFELFQNLMSNTRLGIITRMFVYRPRELTVAQPTARSEQLDRPPDALERPETSSRPGNGQEATSRLPADAETSPQSRDGGKKKRRRHR